MLADFGRAATSSHFQYCLTIYVFVCRIDRFSLLIMHQSNELKGETATQMKLMLFVSYERTDSRNEFHSILETPNYVEFHEFINNFYGTGEGGGKGKIYR